MKRSRAKGAQRRPTKLIRKMEVGSRLIFNVQHEQEPSRGDVAFFAELLNRLRTIGVVWDMNIMSHGGMSQRGTDMDRTVLFESSLTPEPHLSSRQINCRELGQRLRSA